MRMEFYILALGSLVATNMFLISPRLSLILLPNAILSVFGQLLYELTVMRNLSCRGL